MANSTYGGGLVLGSLKATPYMREREGGGREGVSQIFNHLTSLTTAYMSSLTTAYLQIFCNPSHILELSVHHLLRTHMH